MQLLDSCKNHNSKKIVKERLGRQIPLALVTIHFLTITIQQWIIYIISSNKEYRKSHSKLIQLVNKIVHKGTIIPTAITVRV